MAEAILNDYFYGDESEEFIFFRIPRLLITSPRFKHLSTDAKLLYGMLLDRMSLSAKNGWCDDTGRVFIYYTLDDICDDLMCCTEKAVKLLAELDTKKGVGLIERIKQGQGKPTKIYVKRFTGQTAPNPELGKTEVQTSENRSVVILIKIILILVITIYPSPLVPRQRWSWDWRWIDTKKENVSKKTLITKFCNSSVPMMT